MLGQQGHMTDREVSPLLSGMFELCSLYILIYQESPLLYHHRHSSPGWANTVHTFSV